MSLRVLTVGNFGGDFDKGNRCGIANFAVQTSKALRRVGCDVTDWDGRYPTIYEKVQRGVPAYLPADADTYDVIHFTWHPLAINHYGFDHWPTARREDIEGPDSRPGDRTWIEIERPLLSIYLTDLPPHSWCPCLEAFQVRVSAQPHEILATPTCPGVILPYPIVDWLDDLPPPNDRFTVGWTGIRGDGQAILARQVEMHNWKWNPSDPETWLSLEDEAARLARSTVNVCWYHEQRNIAGAPSTCLSSRRPLLINRSGMFDHLQPYGDEIYIGHAAGHDEPELALMLELIERDWKDHMLKVPTRVYADYGWTASAKRLVAAWEEARRA